MARRVVEMKPGAWSRWFVHLDGDEASCRFHLHEANVWDPDGSNPRFQNPYKPPTPDMADVTPIMSGTVDFTGDVTAEMPKRYLGKVDEVADLRDAWAWALAQARQHMLDQGGYVDWMPV